MKLSTSGYSRGKVGSIAAFIVMALLVTAQLDPALICGGGIVTWLAVTWFLSANKDKEVFEMAKGTNAVQLYYEAVNELTGDLVKEGIFVDEKLNALMEDRSESARIKEKNLYQLKLHMARDRLKRLRSISPPKEAATIHKVFLGAFDMGVEARKQALAGNYFDASAAYEIASREIGRGNEMWDELGVMKYPVL